MRLFSNIFDKVMKLSKAKHAPSILGAFSFLESIIIPIAVDVLLISMVLADKSKALKYFTITIAFSLFGGVFGSCLGMFFIDVVYGYIVSFGYEPSYILVQHWFEEWGFWAVFVAGFTPIPYKIFTISAGAFHMNLVSFIVASFISRGLRFGLVCFCVYKFESQFTKIASRYIDLIGWISVLILVILYFIYS